MPAPITHRRVLRIAVPIVLSNATVPILGAVDTGVVGQLGAPEPIGAVGIGAIILTSVYWFFGFLRMGTTGLASQAQGAGNAAEVSAILSRAMLVAGAAGLAMILLQAPIMAFGFALSPASEGVESMARDYMQIRIWSAPAAIAIFGINGWLIALERTRSVLLIQFWMNGLNIALDFWFVLGLGWGVAGVSTATFLSEWSGLALGLFLARDAFRGTAWRSAARVFDALALKRMAIVNTDIMIRSIMLLATMTSFMMLGAGLGDVTLAANQVLLQFLQITAFALDGFAFAAEAIVGQAMGRGSLADLRLGARLASVWGGAAVIAMALAFWLFGGAIIDLMTTAPGVRLAARDYLPWMILSPLLGVMPWMLDGIFIGATRTRDMRNMMILSAAIYAVAVAILLPLYGNHGLWAALMVSFVARGLTLWLRYPALERAVAAPA